MNNARLPSLLLLAAALALTGRADESTTTAAFSDPAKPGTLKVHLFHGDLVIHGADVKEITVKSEATSVQPTPRKDGMRVLSNTSGYLISEKDNVATLDYGNDGWTGGSSDFDITVPRNTNLIISNSTSGDFVCRDISGDIDIRRLGGDVKLQDISGGALVETMSGDVTVKVKSLAAGRPLSFTSMRGEIRLRLPADAKANVRFRTHRGVILTDFDDKALVTKTEVSRSPSHRAHPPKEPAAPTAPVAPDAPAAPSAPATSSPDSITIYRSHSEKDDDHDGDGDSDWHAEVRESVREAAREAADAAREAADAVHEGLEEFHVEMSGMMPALPPMTGGKVISGTLNGGGVEIQAATLNGDITLKKSE